MYVARIRRSPPVYDRWYQRRMVPARTPEESTRPVPAPVPARTPEESTPEESTLWWSEFKPVTAMYWWRTFDGTMQRVAFACTMGSTAVVLNALLWLLSMPWIAWKLFKWTFSKVRRPVRGERSRGDMFVPTYSSCLKTFPVHSAPMGLPRCGSFHVPLSVFPSMFPCRSSVSCTLVGLPLHVPLSVFRFMYPCRSSVPCTLVGLPFHVPLSVFRSMYPCRSSVPCTLVGLPCAVRCLSSPSHLFTAAMLRFASAHFDHKYIIIYFTCA